MLDKIYAAIYTGLEIRNLNGAKHFGKPNIGRKERRKAGRQEGKKEGRKGKKERGRKGGWKENKWVHYSNYSNCRTRISSRT